MKLLLVASQVGAGAEGRGGRVGGGGSAGSRGQCKLCRWVACWRELQGAADSGRRGAGARAAGYRQSNHRWVQQQTKRKVGGRGSGWGRGIESRNWGGGETEQQNRTQVQLQVT